MTAIREQILVNIKTTLEGISIANGYSNNISSVQRWRQKGNDFEATPFIILKTDTEQKFPYSDELYECDLRCFIEIGTIDQSDASETAMCSLLSDVEKALMIDITRGGLASDTVIIGNMPFPTSENQDYCGIIVNIQIKYQHYQTDPDIQG
jgi:hypothetical protein